MDDMKARRRKPRPPRGPIPRVIVPVSRCPICGSTEREDYHGTRTLEVGGVLPDGTVYRRVVWRNTRCRSCGQARVDKTYE